MRHASFDHLNCSIARALDEIGDWWTLLILRDAQLGVTRFDDFHNSLGISRNTLTTRLGRLVADGVLERARVAGSLRDEYVLSDKGRDLWRVITALRQWGDRWITPAGEQPVILHHLACGRDATALLVCSECGEELIREELRNRPGPGAT